jgi:4-hydroxy-tetrahydrodipicolinate reductase
VIALVLAGAAGRMGRAVEQAAAGAGDLAVRLRLDRADAAAAGGAGWSDDPGAIRTGDVVVDFSAPGFLRRVAAACAERGAPLVTGTTGLGPEEERSLADAARRVAVLRAANFSLGVLALRRALASALESLPATWDIEIVERHHRQKADSPSGTALLLAREASERRGLPPEALRHGRQGRLGPRPAREIGLHAVRGGTWVGDHTVLLAGEGEWVELRHITQDRGAFAHGALAAARFVASAAPGLYTLEDVSRAKGRS